MEEELRDFGLTENEVRIYQGSHHGSYHKYSLFIEGVITDGNLFVINEDGSSRQLNRVN